MDPNEQQGNDQFSQPQVVQPEDMFNPSVTVKPPTPATPPVSMGQAPSTPDTSSDFSPMSDGINRKKVLIIVGGIVGIFILAVIIILLTSSSDNKDKKQNTGQDDSTSGILNPPSAIDIENANNSISSDITGLNDDNDFPTANLSDTNLQL